MAALIAVVAAVVEAVVVRETAAVADLPMHLCCRRIEFA